MDWNVTFSGLTHPTNVLSPHCLVMVTVLDSWWSGKGRKQQYKPQNRSGSRASSVSGTRASRELR